MLFKMKDLSAIPESLARNSETTPAVPHRIRLFFLSSVNPTLRHTHTVRHTISSLASCFIMALCWQCGLPLKSSLLVLNYSQKDLLWAICVHFCAITSPNQSQADESTASNIPTSHFACYTPSVVLENWNSTSKITIFWNENPRKKC